MKLLTLVLCTIFFTTSIPTFAEANVSNIGLMTHSGSLSVIPKNKKETKVQKKLKTQKPDKIAISSKPFFMWGIIFLAIGAGDVIYLLVAGVTGTLLIVFIVLAGLLALWGIYNIIRGVMLKKQGY